MSRSWAASARASTQSEAPFQGYTRHRHGVSIAVHQTSREMRTLDRLLSAAHCDDSIRVVLVFPQSQEAEKFGFVRAIILNAARVKGRCGVGGKSQERITESLGNLSFREARWCRFGDDRRFLSLHIRKGLGQSRWAKKPRPRKGSTFCWAELAPFRFVDDVDSSLRLEG